MTAFDSPRAIDRGARWFAQGMSEHLLGIARRNGAPPESLAILERAVDALVAAARAGETCARFEDLAEVSTEASRRALLATGLVSDEPTAGTLPLVLDAGGRLYFARYFDYERRLAAALTTLARCAPRSAAEQRESLDRLFERNAAALDPGEPDWQKLAAALALRSRLTIVSGGPGTGKTTTLAALLACLLERDPSTRIVLAAPTGKAAARMLSALGQAAAALPETVRSLLPRESYTVHRLLGARAQSAGFRHDAAHPLALDALALDEASMIDLALATRLVEALPADARLILLGDKDQLASVEAGSVFGALCANPGLSPRCRQALEDATGIPAAAIAPSAGSSLAPLADTTIWLVRNYRFGAGSAIGRLAAALRSGDPAALEVLAENAGELRLHTPPAGPLSGALIEELLGGYADFIARLRGRQTDPAAMLEAFERYRVLAAVRRGSRGVETVGEALEQRLRRALGREAPRANPWFHGRPVLIERNDYALGLYNGDVGIATEDGRGGFEVWFAEASGGMRTVPATRLPTHETALAMTVHRAQGSEFDRVALILPEADNPVLTRELLYTAVTRARSEVSIYSAPERFAQALSRAVRRSGGLGARLEDAAQPPGTRESQA